MSRMTYLWTEADWRRSFEERIGNLWMINIINLLVVVGTLLLHPQTQNGADARFFLPAMMLAVDFALCYVFLDDVHNGCFAGITCGASFGVMVLALFPCLDHGVSAIVPPMLGVAVAFVAFWYAASYYNGKLALLKQGGIEAVSRRRRTAY